MFIKRQTSDTTSGNEWQRMTASGTTNDNEWQQVIQRGAMSDKEWQHMTRSGTTNKNEWKRIRVRKESHFGFRMEQYMQCITAIYSAI